MRTSSHRRWQWGLTCLAVLVLAYPAYQAVRLLTIVQRARPHAQNLMALRELPPDLWTTPATLEKASSDLRALNSALAQSAGLLRPEIWLMSHLGWVPGLGGDLAAVPVLLDIGVEASATGEAVLGVILPFARLNAERPLAAWSLQQSSEIGASLERAKSFCQEALDHFDRAAESLDRLESMPRARQLAPRLEPYLELIKPALPLARLGLRTAARDPEVIDAALGLSRPRRYLILLQNPWEIRPAGGFITAAFVVTATGGSMELGPFINSWDVDLEPEKLPPPPPTLYQAIWAGKINFLNANWSPDFPTSAAWAQRLFEIGRNIDLDGTIAFDPVVIQNLLRAAGTVSVEEYQATVTADNLWEQLIRFHDEPLGVADDATQGDRLLKRKEFLPLLAEPLMRQLQAGMRDPSEMVALAIEVQRSLSERHLLVAADDSQVADWLARQKWDGGLVHTGGDYFQLVDANVGFNKADARVSRDVEYQVDLTPDGGGLARAVVTYRNRSRGAEKTSCVQELPSGGYAEGWLDACYWTYARIYVPAGSQLLSASPSQWPTGTVWARQNPSAGRPGPQTGPEEQERQVLGLMVVVPPQQQVSVSFVYRLPSGVWNVPDGYRLYIQKQSGTISTTVRVRVNLPAGVTVTGSNGDVMDAQVIARRSLVTDELFYAELAGAEFASAGIPTSTATPTRPTPRPTATLTSVPSSTPGPSPTRVVLLVTATPSPPSSASEPADAATGTPAGTEQATPAVRPVPTVALPPAYPVPEPVLSPGLVWSRIQIPSIQVDGIVVEVGWQLVGAPGARRAEWEVAAFAAGHHKDSAYPGQTGNVVMSGHHNMLGEVFRNLWDLRPGDRIYLTDSRGTIYLYVTRAVYVLLEEGATPEEQAAHLRFLEQRPEDILTLVTCWPYEGNSHRIIVVADLAGTVDSVEAP